MNVGEERRRRCIAIGRGFLLLAPFPIYASRVVTRPARWGGSLGCEERERERERERESGKDGTEKKVERDERRDEAFKMADREAASSRCFRTVRI